MRRALRVLLMLPFLGLGCDTVPIIAWRTPVMGQEVTWMPLRPVFDFQAEGADLGSVVVELNGHDVTNLFTFDAPLNGRISAHAEGVWGPGFVLPGANVLQAGMYIGTRGYSVTISFTAVGDPYADSVAAFVPGAAAGFGQSSLPSIVLGPPAGAGLFAGGLQVVSLGANGRIDVGFTNNVIVNGPGVDFTVFENAFLQIGAFSVTAAPFAEPGRVSVSQDGVTWHTFPCAMASPPLFSGCAGVYPVLSNGSNPASPHASIPSTTPIASLVGVSAIGLATPAGSGGDSFDLASVGLAWARYVRVEASGSATGPEGTDNARFDLDAVAAVNAAPATDANGNGIPDAVE